MQILVNRSQTCEHLVGYVSIFRYYIVLSNIMHTIVRIVKKERKNAKPNGYFWYRSKHTTHRLREVSCLLFIYTYGQILQLLNHKNANLGLTIRMQPAITPRKPIRWRHLKNNVSSETAYFGDIFFFSSLLLKNRISVIHKRFWKM